MIDVYDSETLVKIYRMLNKKCEAIDGYIKNQAYAFSGAEVEFDAEDIYNGILDLMARKNQLINLKLILDSAVEDLDCEDKKIILLKMNYSLSVKEICEVLELSRRTAFRRMEHALVKLAKALNNSKYLEKLISIMNTEVWISRLRENVRSRRLAYKTATV